MSNWDSKFVGLANHISTWSKDRSTKVGAVVVNERNKVVSLGYNGFPIGFNDNIDERHNRPQKYDYTEHAERNAIYSAAELGVSLVNCTIYLNWFPCPDCARAVIQSGIKTVVCYRQDMDNPRWKDGFDKSNEMLKECGVCIRFVD